jgi:DNA polymerase I
VSVASGAAGDYSSAVTRFTIVDGSGYIFRAYFALKQARSGGRSIELSTSYGMPTGALHVFSSMMMRLHLDEKPELAAVVFDAEGQTFRHKLDREYKATRRDMPPDLAPQLPWFERIAVAFRMPVLRVPGVEADDVIASLVRRARAFGMEVVIYGADKDLMQLVGPGVTMIDSMREITYDAERVKQKFGVGPEKVRDWLALRGDSSDNIPGVEGIGEVTATKLLTEFGTIEGVLANLDKVRGKIADKLRDPVQLRALELSRTLVTLRDDIEVPDLLSFGRKEWDQPALTEIFTALEFTSILTRLQATFATDPATYRTLLDVADVEALLARARAAGEVAVHVVSTPPGPSKPALVGVALAVPGEAPAYVPSSHRYLGAPRQIEPAALLALLRPILTDPAVRKVVHDVKSARLVTGIDIEPVPADPMIAAYLLDPGAAGYGLPAVAKRYLDHATVPLEEVCGKGRDAKAFEECDVAAATRWAAEAADVSLALGKLLAARVAQSGMGKLLDEIEMPLTRCLQRMEELGVAMDVPVLRQLGQEIGDECVRLEKQIQEIAGFPLNPLSPKQLQELLFERLGLRSDHMRKLKSGGFSTDAEQLEELVDEHPIIKPLLEHRELIKLKGTYLDPLPAWVAADGRLHTSYIQVAASTGRLASRDPNIQNIPIRTDLGRRIRRAFVAQPGHVLVSADYSQIELRVIAHLSDDPLLVRAFVEDKDVHGETAAEVFGVARDAVTPLMRRVAKAVNYGLGYGQSDYGLSRVLDIPREEARKYIETYFGRFPGVRTYMEAAIAEARRTQVLRTILGRRIPIPMITSGRYAERAAAERFARNAPIQGSAADILKLAMLRMQALDARMLLTVHDELVFEIPEAEAPAFAALAKREMEAAYSLKVPLKVDVGISATWAGAH